ncbi:MAG: protein kinase, partial [Acidobacteriota bacterium]
TDSGGDWIVMEHVDGVTVHQLLRDGPLDLRMVLAIAWDVANGLAAAHANGVLHRDLKAENVMVTPSGEAKILDFGLAKRFEGRLDEASLSIDGAVVGTCRAMSPEQAHGEDLDPRSDLFSLGTLLYEMSTGASPFHAPSFLRTLIRVCEHEQLPASLKNPLVPQALSDLIDGLLQKDPGQRPQSARGVAAQLADIGDALPRESRTEERTLTRVDTDRIHLAELEAASSGSRPIGPAAETSISTPVRAAGRGLGKRFPWKPWGAAAALLVALISAVVFVARSPGPQNPTEPAGAGGVPPSAVAGEPTGPTRIVVLPFRSLGPADKDYFAAGITEEVTRGLTQLSGLGVISRTSASRLAGAGKSIRQIGSELDVAFVLEGTVTWPPGDEGNVRITPKLIEVAKDTYVWTESYERPLDDFLQVQSEIAGHVVEELGVALLQPERQALEAPKTDVPAAYFAYLRGLDHAHGSTGVSEDSQRRAVSMFEAAIEGDPGFIAAHAELARAHALIYLNYDRSEDRRERARSALAEAQRLGPDEPEVHLAAAYILYHVESEYDRALEEFVAAGRRLPNSGEVASAIAFVMRRQGRLDEAIEKMEAAFLYDQANARLASHIAETYRAVRRHADAERWFLTALDLAPDMHDTLGERAENLLSWRGCGDDGDGCSVDAARAVLEASPIRDDPKLYPYWLQLDLYDGAIGDGLARLRASRSRGSADGDGWTRWLWREAMIYRQAGLGGEAAALVESRRTELEARVASTGLYLDYARLGLAYAFLGRHGDAEAAGRRAAELAVGDHFTGPRTREALALILTLGGKKEEAVMLLGELSRLDYPHSLSRVDLRLDPAWDPLRGEPEFRLLLE